MSVKSRIFFSAAFIAYRVGKLSRTRRGLRPLRAVCRKLSNWFEPGVITRDGRCWYIDDLRGYLQEGLLYGVPYDPESELLLRRNIQRGDCIVEVGANCGYFSCLMAEWIGRTGHVYAFECSPHHYKTLEQNVRCQGLTNVTLFELALSDRPGEAEIFSTGATGSLVSTVYSDAIAKDKVRTMPLDEVFPPELHDQVDLIKIDVDGWEAPVLRGAEGIIAKSRPRLIVELQESNQQAAGSSVLALLKQIHSYGYHFQLGHGPRATTPEAAFEVFRLGDVYEDVLCLPAS